MYFSGFISLRGLQRFFCDCGSRCYPACSLAPRPCDLEARWTVGRARLRPPRFLSRLPSSGRGGLPPSSVVLDSSISSVVLDSSIYAVVLDSSISSVVLDSSIGSPGLGGALRAPRGRGGRGGGAPGGLPPPGGGRPNPPCMTYCACPSSARRRQKNP